jgi:hypothetical protein
VGRWSIDPGALGSRKLDNPESGLGQTEFAPPARCTATVTAGKKKAKRQFTVLRSPIQND